MKTFSWPEHVGDLLFGKAFPEQQRTTLRLFSEWETCVGAELAKRIMPLSFGHGVLCIKAISPAWQQELTYLKKNIIDKIHQTLGVVFIKDLKIFSGHWDPNPKETVEATPVRAVPTEEEVLSAKATAQLISDPDVRDAFAHTMAQALALQRMHALKK